MTSNDVQLIGMNTAGEYMYIRTEAKLLVIVGAIRKETEVHVSA